MSSSDKTRLLVESNLEVVKDLYRSDSFVLDNVDERERTVLHLLVENHEHFNYEVFEFIRNRVSLHQINAQEKTKGETALHLATKYNMTSVARDLRDAGADPNIQNKAGETAFHYLIKYCS